MGDLIFAADSHINADDAHAESFVRFLGTVGPTASTLILVGDIFDLWVARPGMETSYHRKLVDAVAELRRAGVVVKYVEGNRDYYIRERHSIRSFDEVAEVALAVQHGGRRFHVEHGDQVNRRDRQYLLWRALSRSVLGRGAFGAIPIAHRRRIVERVEVKMRRTNRKFRIAFPEDQAEAFARRAFRGGADTIVLGHFHQARLLELEGTESGRPGQLYVLPGWREDRRYLRFNAAGEGRFVEFVS